MTSTVPGEVGRRAFRARVGSAAPFRAPTAPCQSIGEPSPSFRPDMTPPRMLSTLAYGDSAAS